MLINLLLYLLENFDIIHLVEGEIMNEYSPNVSEHNNNIIISGINFFDLEQTFDCGQAFRWSKVTDNKWRGIANGRIIEIGLINEQIILYNTTIKEYDTFWCEYLDIKRDYGKIISEISNNDILKIAAEQNKGIRILKQDPWEALCSFIISQNNNIPRIKGIIERLCENFGEDLGGYYSFPTAEKIANLSVDELSVLRAGFRARYIIDAAKKVVNNEIDFNVVKNSDIDTARNELMKILGVGVKVADCTLLFGFSRIEALPKDVWIKKAIAEYFNGEFPECAIPYAGIAQQYLFNYIRKTTV